MRKYLIVTVVTAMALIASCSKSQSQIKIKGSDTELSLVSGFAEAYQEANPKINISVTGGGSGTGIAALLNGQIDIANASRTMKKKEYKRAAKKGIKPVWIVIATDGVSVVINPENGVSKLTVPQIAAIFKGEIKNWKEVGGKDQKINCYGRQSNSGTFEFFKKKVLRKKDFSADVRRMNGNAQIVKAVESDKSGVGYVGIGFVTPAVKVVEIAKNKNSKYIKPTRVTIMNDTYPLTRPLNQYLNGKPTGEVKKFINFCLYSQKSIEIIKKNAFFPIQPKYVSVNRKAGF